MRIGKSRLLAVLTTVVVASALSAFALASSASAAGTCATATPQYCPVPVVGTVGASLITNHSVELSGLVNPEGAPTSCTFQYGPSTNYGSFTTYAQNITGTSSVVTSVTVSGLQESTIFHFRLICFNAAGFGNPSADDTFTTAANSGTTPVTTTSKVSIVNATGFVSKAGTVGLFISCFGSTTCAGKFTIKIGRSTVASANYSLGANKGGPVNAKLSSSALKSLKKKKVLAATARAADSAGPFATRTIHLHFYT
jgi:hypothetical protein